MRREKKDREKKQEKKKKRGFGKFFAVMIIVLMVGLGAYLGYSISRNGGGLQGVLATVLGQDIEDLQDLDTINILLLRSQ